MHRRIVIVVLLLIAQSICAQPRTDADYAADEATLRSQNLPTKGEQLLEILKKRIPSETVIAGFKKNAARLGKGVYSERMNAQRDLLAMGPVVRVLIETARRDTPSDAETDGRLRQVLEQFPAERDYASATAATRLIARDKPAGSLPILFDFVVYATNETVRQNIQHAINVVGISENKPAPLVIEMLTSKNPSQRAAAGETLVRKFGPSAKEQIGHLLKDTHPQVRYQIGLGLTEKLDKAGLPILIQSLADLPADRMDVALETLFLVAGENAPSANHPGPAKVQAFVADWQKWYDKYHAKLDLAKQYAREELGFTVLGVTALKANTKNKIYEVGKDKVVRWEFDGPRYPLDVQILGPNRLLVAEYFDRRVTERDFKGNVLWQANANMPIACQRLSNGNTFIATRQSLVIVDRDGRDVFSWQSPGASIMAAFHKRNGEIAVATSGGRCQLLDPQGRELKSFMLGGAIYSLGGQIEVLPNGRVLVPLYNNQAVVEFDWEGKRHWQINVPTPVSATRLSNGNTLVTCSLSYRIVEFDPMGREVWSLQTEGRPFRARRR